MANDCAPFSLRVSEELPAKAKAIAVQNKRSASKETESVPEQYMTAFEERHGPVPVDGDDL